ncbi:aminoacyl-tRNA hydrolase [Buchnera aphidicola]|uniref:Peptidyl-tRNA hydrolase n=1 Tax=Buchnera aphidicola (Cinara strobi) TaxID=1921549 RepID=A0A3B1E9E6_9GAMM|nr:aminoacyl-tRNA hydrolase [Buchnera aphidicola]VAX76419.1 Peptidyl-tRNA hydrolase [Buchnera aphidicola (Cinara strobi)]
MKRIKMIVGLGNKSNQYYNTRHSAGFWFIDAIANFYKTELKFKKKFYGYISSIKLHNKIIYLLRPNLFMNVSGYSVKAVSLFYKISLSEILIVRDELNILPGFFKIKYGRYHNGHNGIKSIINNLKSGSSFFQLCLGIGRPRFQEDVSKYVLSEPNDIEAKKIHRLILRFIFFTKENIYKKEFLKSKIVL